MSNNSLPSVSITITGDATDLINTSVTQPVGTVMSTLQSIWNLTFGKFDHWNNKIKIKRESELLQLRQNIFEKTSRIPEEFITEPKMSIVGPAMEASQFYFEESYYREMFSNLIAASMDSRISSKVHPAFVEFIKQLTPDDAKLLYNAKMNHVESFPVVRVKLVNIRDNSQVHLPFTKEIFLPDYLNANIEASLNEILDNLSRLNIISYGFDSFLTNESKYDFSKRVQIYLEKLAEYEQSTTQKIELAKGVGRLTNLGEEFIKIVL